MFAWPDNNARLTAFGDTQATLTEAQLRLICTESELEELMRAGVNVTFSARWQPLVASRVYVDIALAGRQANDIITWNGDWRHVLLQPPGPLWVQAVLGNGRTVRLWTTSDSGTMKP